MTHALRELFLLEVSDPRLVGVEVTSVAITSDFRLAHVHYVIGGPGVARNADKETQALRGFKKVSPFLRHRLNDKVSLKYSPELEFHYDEGMEKGLRIERILRDLERE